MLYLSDKLICLNTDFGESQKVAWRFPDGELEKGKLYVLSGFVIGDMGAPIRITITGKRCTCILNEDKERDVGFAPERFVKLSEVKKNPARYAGIIY